MKNRRVERLVELAGLVRDHDLSALKAAVGRRDATVALRDGLSADTSDDPAGWHAQAVYGQWVEHQRQALTARIEEQAGEVATVQAKARVSFARAQVLEKLRDQLS